MSSDASGCRGKVLIARRGFLSEIQIAAVEVVRVVQGGRATHTLRQDSTVRCGQILVRKQLTGTELYVTQTTVDMIVVVRIGDSNGSRARHLSVSDLVESLACLEYHSR
ncbi:hypothetical protein MKK75_22325 [Methylobacterium sp. J-030]|uniref:hypothetical protein n=1 Tax=Methylobacterium sp. J-030 TaxID=2836627 RepID=UPI001FB88BF0|nr:hypothetical protein [Methylobacterium sp. J-030]MCJ2071500.1 hypothetical protein [Methylobacterium sp. J-030]